MPILNRILASFVLLTATFNPTNVNYVTWARTQGSENLSILVFVGLILLIGYIVFLRATLRSIGFIGMGLFLALFSSLIWVLVDFGVLNLEDPTANTWIALVGASILLETGMSWSIVRRRLSGQADVDDVDEE